MTETAAEIRAKLQKMYALRDRQLEDSGNLTSYDKQVKKECEGSLLEFCRHAWHVLEPGREMLIAWPLEAMCLHLEAVTSGEIKRLLINVPPGTMKSLLTRIFWPAWEWGPQRLAELRYLSASFNNSLSTRDARRLRELITSEWYQKLWPAVKLSRDQSEKANFENTARGFMRTIVVSGTTGFRGDRVLVDDPHDVSEAESDTIRENTLTWFRESVPSRLNDYDNSAIIVIMQRVHEEDVSGHIISNNENYVHLCIPLHYDPGRHCRTIIGWEDPRTEDGENFWPERYTESYLKEVTAAGNMGPYAVSAQFEQMPAPRGGGIIKDEWWKLWDINEWPPLEFVVASLDTAYTTKQENDFSALTVWGVFRDKNSLPKIIMMYAWQKKLELNDLVNETQKTCKKFKVDRLLIEDKAAGHSVAQELRRLFGASEFGIQLVNPGAQDKVARVYSIQHLFAEGIIFAPDKVWADMVIKQFSGFPKTKNDDLVDSGSMAIRWLRDSGWALRKEENDAIIAEEFAPRGRQEAIYDV